MKVKQIIVCAHYGCGGVRAAMSRPDLAVINKWLRHIKDIYRLHANEVNAVPNEERRYERLVELNVFEQVNHLAQLSFVQHTWKLEQRKSRIARPDYLRIAWNTSSVRKAVVVRSRKRIWTSVSDGRCSAKYFWRWALSITVDTSATGYR